MIWPRERVDLSCRRETGVPCPDARRGPTSPGRGPRGTTPVSEPASRSHHGDERAKYHPRSAHEWPPASLEEPGCCGESASAPLALPRLP